MRIIPGKGLAFNKSEYRDAKPSANARAIYSPEAQNIFLNESYSNLRRFLPDISEPDTNGNILMSRLSPSGKEMLSQSKPYPPGKVPQRELQSFKLELAKLGEFANADTTPEENKRLVESLRLPDLDELPHFYRKVGPFWRRRLMVVWGIEPNEASYEASVSTDTYLDGFVESPYTGGRWRFLRWLGLLALIIALLLLLRYCSDDFGLFEGDGPKAENDTFTLAPGAATFLDVLQNDEAGASGGPLSIIEVNDGEIVGQPGEQFIKFQAPLPFEEPVKLIYHISDASGERDRATVTVTPGSGSVDEDVPPIVLSETYSLPFGEVCLIDVLANATDPNGDRLDIVPDIVGQGEVKNYRGKNWIQVVAPEQGVPPYGIEYIIADGLGGSTKGTAIIEGVAENPDAVCLDGPLPREVNRPPFVPDVIRDGIVGQEVWFGLMEDASDPEGDPLRLVDIDRDPIDQRKTVDGRVEVLVRIPDFQEVYNFRVTDGFNDPVSASLTVRSGTSDNLQPIVNPDTRTGAPGQPIFVPVLRNDRASRPEFEPLIIVGVSDDTVEIIQDGIPGLVIRAPASATNAPRRVTYEVQDQEGRRGTSHVRVFASDTVNPPPPPPPPPENRPPNAVDDDIEGPPGTTAQVFVTLNDTDADGDRLTVTRLEPAADVQIRQLSATGDPYIETVFPAEGQEKELTYTISDGKGGVDSASVTLRGNSQAKPPEVPEPPEGTDPEEPGVRDPEEEGPEDMEPRANDDERTGLPGAIAFIDVLVNDDKGSKGPLTIVYVDSPAEITPGGVGGVGGISAVFPEDGFSDRLAYTVRDQAGRTSSANITLIGDANVPPSVRQPELPAGQPPVINPACVFSAPTAEISAIDVFECVSDPDNDLDKLYLLSDAARTDIVDGVRKLLVLGPAEGVERVIDFTVRDEAGNSANGTVTVIGAGSEAQDFLLRVEQVSNDQANRQLVLRAVPLEDNVEIEWRLDAPSLGAVLRPNGNTATIEFADQSGIITVRAVGRRGQQQSNIPIRIKTDVETSLSTDITIGNPDE